MSKTITISLVEYDRLKLAEKLLEELTPTGSEFHHNPRRCYDHVQDTLKSNHEARIRLVRLNKELNNLFK